MEVVIHWSMLPVEVVDVSCLEVFKVRLYRPFEEPDLEKDVPAILDNLQRSFPIQTVL